MQLRHQITQLLIATAILLVCTGLAGATTLRVEKDGSGGFTVIQDAVDAAAVGDTIQIGPGRYDDVRRHQIPGAGEIDTVVWVDIDSLTLRGTDRQDVILGPDVPTGNVDFDPTCIAVYEITGMRVEQLTCEKMEFGVQSVGELAVTNCVFLSHARDGVRNSSIYPLLVSDCYFEGNDTGVSCGPLDSGSVVERCQFNDNRQAINMNQTKNATVSSCQITPGSGIGGIEFQQGATGLIEECNIGPGGIFSGINIVQNCTVELRDNTIAPNDFVSIRHWDDSHVFGSGNVFGGGTRATLELSDSTIDLYDNDILHTTGPSVLLFDYILDPVMTMNLRNNYWGTTEPDSIDAWIVDMNDDPGIKAVVDYEPFRDTSIPTGATSVGGLKARFRGGN